MNETQLDAQRMPSAVSARAGSDLLYVGNARNNAITVYHHDAHGHAAPIAVIAGSKTLIGAPGQLSKDAAGDLYVANNVAMPFGNAFALASTSIGPSISCSRMVQTAMLRRSAKLSAR